ncbi:MAG: EAL domain-containing protein [Clostridia bacterium]
MEAREGLSPFILEFNNLGKFAMHAVQGLRRIDMFFTLQGEEDGVFLTYPEGEEISEAVREALREQIRDANVTCRRNDPLFLVRLSSPEGESFGAICFERSSGAWEEAEHTLLKSIAAVYTYALRAERDRRDASVQNWVWNQMMDSTHACIYVTDPETDEILFMNRSMKRVFGIEAPEGQLCWKVLQKGQEGRCNFCPVRMLIKDQSIPSYVWEEQNPITGRIYENYDSLMKWTDGRLVHFQHSTDVTETRRLYKAAMTDELTGALSRLAGKEALSRLLGKIDSAEEPLCVCMLDINGLKTINDLYGHAAGDALLAQISATIRRLLKGREYLMRLSGDEFVVVMPGVTQADAAARMQKALADFEKERPENFPAGDAFCYGVVEIRERIPLRDVLERADERMYQQKRNLHIRRAEALLSQPQENSTAARFAYDSNRLYDALRKSTDDYVYICNMKTGIFRYPPAMVQEFGLPGEIVPNAAAVWGAKVHPHDKRIFMESNQEIMDGRTDTHCVEYRAQNIHGEWVWLRCRGHVERDQNGEPILFAGFITDLGKKNKIDSLTGLYNKFELENDVLHMLDTAAPQPLTFILLGVDGLKRINSLYDRVFGDEVLRITAQRLRSLLPPNAAVYRMDGDEFAILLRGNARTAADQLFYLIRDTFDAQQIFDGKKFYCTLSGGCAFAPEDGITYPDLARCASYALDYAKSRGKNRMEYYTDEIVTNRRRRLELTELLRESIEQGFTGFQMVYQPIFSASRKLTGAEALARWRCDKYGAVAPDEFIPLLEQSRLILPVGRWILEEVLRTCARWEKQMPDFEMGINLSYIQLEDEGFYAFMTDAVRKAGVDPKHIILELTESYLASNMTRIAQQLVGIRHCGIRIAMDDFGTGYSSLGILKQAPIDIAKIDRTFVKDIQSSPFDNAFLHLVVELCSVLGIDTCLEGVETEDEFEAVRPMSLSYIQGYLLGRPIPAEEFEKKFFH